MTVIHRGDNYIILLAITSNGVKLTPDNIDDVRVSVNGNLKDYSSGLIIFDDSTKDWGYPIKQQESLEYLDHKIPIQVGVKIEDRIKYSDTLLIHLGRSEIVEEW